MEEIQFLNYIFSIVAVLLSGAALRMVFKNHELHEKDMKDIRDKIRQLVDDTNQSKKR